MKERTLLKQLQRKNEKALEEIMKKYGAYVTEYSRAVTPQIRQAGNRLSGLAETAYASLLA